MSENKKIRDILKKSEKITEDKIESVKTGVIKKSSSGVFIPKKTEKVLPIHDRGLVAEREKVEIILEETEEEYSTDLTTQDDLTKEELNEIESAIENVLHLETTESSEEKPSQIIPKIPTTFKHNKPISDMTYQELYDFAKEQRMRGYSSLNKDALIDFITQNLNGEIIEEESEGKEPKLLKMEDKNGVPWNRIIEYDENILKTQNKGNGFRQLKTLKRKIKLCPSMRGIYNHWANKVILHEGANLENI